MNSPHSQNGSGVCSTPRTAGTEAVPPNPHTGVKHVPISTWLLALGLAEYEKLFSKFNGVEDLLSLSEADIRDLGVRNGAHRARMVSTLVIFKEKVHTRKMNKASIRTDTPPGSEGGTPPSQVGHADYAAVGVPSPSQVSAAKVAQVLLGVADNGQHPGAIDLSQYGWYHGNIAREKAESLLVNDGDFLVRDSLSQPGNFVLTVRWRGLPLHFVLNGQPSERADDGRTVVEYQFEGERFERPSELILYHLRERRVVTEMSGAVLGQPIPRTVPSLDGHEPGAAGQRAGSSPWSSPRPSPQGSPRAQPRLCRARRAGSQPLLSFDGGQASSDGAHQQMALRKTAEGGATSTTTTTTMASPHHSQHVDGRSPAVGACRLQHARSSPRLQQKLAVHHRTGSEPAISSAARPAHGAAAGAPGTSGVGRRHLADSDGDLCRNAPPPPKPSRIPTVKRRPGERRPVVPIRNRELYDDDGRDYSDYDQIKSWPSHLEPSEPPAAAAGGDILRHSDAAARGQHRNAQLLYDVPRPSAATVPDGGGDADPDAVTAAPFTLPDPEPASSFDLSGYDSELLTPNNKPLEPSAVTTIKMLLLGSDVKAMAEHVTAADLDLLRVVGVHDLGLGVYSGLELITLPQGHQLRQDIIERYDCLSLFVALTILMCSKCSDRSQMLHQWIQIAIELRGKLGNLYGFSAVMAGLLTPQVRRLRNTWLGLCQHHSESAFMFEHRLRGLLTSLDNASAMLPLQDITVPHIMPLVRLLERDIERDCCHLAAEPGDRDCCHLAAVPSTEVEDDGGYDVDVLLAHLDTARVVTQQCGLYRSTAENAMRQFGRRRDLSDLFATEMHLRLLWGARGATVSRTERFSKFPAVLDLLSERAEPDSAPQSETSV